MVSRLDGAGLEIKLLNHFVCKIIQDHQNLKKNKKKNTLNTEYFLNINFFTIII